MSANISDDANAVGDFKSDGSLDGVPARMVTENFPGGDDGRNSRASLAETDDGRNSRASLAETDTSPTVMASMEERLATAQDTNAVLRSDVTALTKRAKKVEGRIARAQSLAAKGATIMPPATSKKGVKTCPLARPRTGFADFHLEALMAAAKALVNPSAEEAERVAEDLERMLETLRVDGPHDELIAFAVADALRKRARKTDLGREHMYLKKATAEAVVAPVRSKGAPRLSTHAIIAKAPRLTMVIAQHTEASGLGDKQIHLFNLMAENLPTVSNVGLLSCSIMARFTQTKKVVMVDLGIGTGRFQLWLLRQLKRDGKLPPAMTIVGVDIDGDALVEAEQALMAEGKALGIELAFKGFTHKFEEMATEDWSTIHQLASSEPDTHLIVHAAFALHHIPTYSDRDATCAKIKNLKPDLFFLSEPNSDHMTNDLEDRTCHCFHHFRQTFRLIDQMDTPGKIKRIMKSGFFGREIEDMLAKPDDVRVERHESTDAWLERLQRVGMKLLPVEHFEGLQLSHPAEGVALKKADGLCGIEYQGEVLVSLICAEAAW